MLTDYRIIMHTIGFESKDALAGRTRKLSQALNRAEQVVTTMKAEGRTGYVIIRDHIKREIAKTYFVTGQQEPDDDENETDEWNDEGSVHFNTETDRAEIGSRRASDAHRTITG